MVPFISLTCIEFTIVKIHASASDSLLTRNNSPNIQVHPSNGRRAKILSNMALKVQRHINTCANYNSANKFL